MIPERQTYSVLEVQAMLYCMGEKIWRFCAHSSTVDSIGHNAIDKALDEVMEEWK
jgi:hypothetical protein